MSNKATKRSALSLKGKTFAVFTGDGTRVDLQRYFRSEAGQKALGRGDGRSTRQTAAPARVRADVTPR